MGGATGSELYEDNIPGHADLEAMEDWIYGPTHSGQELNGQRKTAETRPKKGTPRFEYETNTGFNVWAQEWRRVHAEDTTQFTNRYVTSTSNDQWIPSYLEKQDDVMDCFRRSIAKEGGRVYFNSLDGFYITTSQNSYDHYWRGSEGNIGDYAKHINDWLYKEILELGVDNITGPLGVVIMDYVGEGKGGTNLPKIIINNNFKFPLEEDPNYVPGQ